MPHITLKSIANNAEIDVIWDKWQAKLEPLREKLNRALTTSWQEWEIPREADAKWPDAAKTLHADWWQARIARQKEIDASIAAKAEFEYLYDKPYEDKKKVRVAGPFTVESLPPHRMLGVDENDELIDPLKNGHGEKQSFEQMVLENLKTAGVQQAHKEDRITFTALTPWPGALVCAEGRYLEGDTTKRAAIFIGPEFGTVQRQDLVLAAREAGVANFDVLIACAFNYEAHTTEFGFATQSPTCNAFQPSATQSVLPFFLSNSSPFYPISANSMVHLEPITGGLDFHGLLTTLTGEVHTFGGVGGVTLESGAPFLWCIMNSFLKYGGAFVLIFGIVGAIYFFTFFETSIRVSGNLFGIDRVSNLGLMSERQNGLMFNFGACVLGAIALVAGCVLDHLESMKSLGNHQPGQGQFASASYSQETKWYLARNNKKYGPYAKKEFMSFDLSPKEMVLQEGTTKWTTAGSVQELRCPNGLKTLLTTDLGKLIPKELKTLMFVVGVLFVSISFWAAYNGVFVDGRAKLERQIQDNRF